MENLPPQVLRLVYKEVSALAADPPEGIKIYPSEEDITELHTAIEGPGKKCIFLSFFIKDMAYISYLRFVFPFLHNRRNSLCRWGVQDAFGPWEGFSCCTS